MRSCGILMPVFSLDSDYGIGTLGKSAYEFVDFLCEAGQTYWQILPLNPTNYGDSPYLSFSSSAGNPFFIDLDILCKEGLLKKEDYSEVDFGNDPSRVDYTKLNKNRYPVLRKAFSRFNREDPEFLSFCAREGDWLEQYALFTAIKNSRSGSGWYEWEDQLKRRAPEAIAAAEQTHSEETAFFRFIQYEFYKQWYALKEYANGKGIRIIGDLPIYVDYDSSDVWCNTDIFDLDESLSPKMIAGCPPDAFCADGQLWGMPVYNWEYMKSQSIPYKWWRERMTRAFRVYDCVRIDHFRGLESFYCVPNGSANARKGEWRKGPGMDLFDRLTEDYGAKLPVIAEDLGFLTPEVRDLLKKTGFPGMKVLQFAFDSREDSDYLPHNYEKNCVVYAGTHDNNTVIGWTRTAPQADVLYARRYLHVDDNEGFNWAMIRAGMASVADTAIFLMADYMGLDGSARINIPATVGGNWQWRITKGCVNSWLAGIIRDNTGIYCRLPKRSDKT